MFVCMLEFTVFMISYRIAKFLEIYLFIKFMFDHRFDMSSIVLESGYKYTFEVNATDYVGNKALPSAWTWYTGKIRLKATRWICNLSLQYTHRCA